MVETFTSKFGVEDYEEVTWRLTFDGKHYFAEFADRIINGSISFHDFLDNIRVGKTARLEIDDEGSFFTISVAPVEGETGVVKVGIQEARGGRQTEVTIDTDAFVGEVATSIDRLVGQFEESSYLVNTVFENYNKN